MSGSVEDTGTIRCGYWNSPLRFAGQVELAAAVGLVAEVEAGVAKLPALVLPQGAGPTMVTRVV